MAEGPGFAGDSLPLLLLAMPADLRTLARWATATRQRALQEDVGYALHAAMKATLGDHAPKPFALVERPGSTQVVGYTRIAQEDLARAMQLAATADPQAARALGLHEGGGALVKSLPHDWRAGEKFSFEVRVAPVIRSRRSGGYAEMDAAFHPQFCGDSPGDRDAAYAAWLAQELGRDGAALLLQERTVRYELTGIARRLRAHEPGLRETRGGLLPDLSVRGLLQVQDPRAFDALLARGLGRHRSFGFGCILLAPAGAWR